MSRFPSSFRSLSFIQSISGLILVLAGPVAHASSVSYNDQSLWSGALGGASITVFHFDGPTETNNLAVNAGSIAPSYSSQGVDFLPFEGTSVYPVILRGQDYQINTPGRDGLLANTSLLSRTEANSAILFNFNTTIRAVGAFSNNIDRGTLEAYDGNGNLIGSALIGHDGLGQFGGIVTDTAIAQVKLVNTFNADYAWGIYDLQFSPGTSRTTAVPEAGSTVALLGVALISLACFRRRTFR